MLEVIALILQQKKAAGQWRYGIDRSATIFYPKAGLWTEESSFWMEMELDRRTDKDILLCVRRWEMQQLDRKKGTARCWSGFNYMLICARGECANILLLYILLSVDILSFCPNWNESRHHSPVATEKRCSAVSWNRDRQTLWMELVDNLNRICFLI